MSVNGFIVDFPGYPGSKTYESRKAAIAQIRLDFRSLPGNFQPEPEEIYGE